MVQVDVQRAVALAVHLPIAGIIPFLRPVHKPPFDRVGVDVTDAVDGRRMGKDVAIIAAKGCVLEQRDAAITAKRQLVAVAGHVVAFASLFDFVGVFQLHTACLLPGTHKLRLKVPHILIDY